MPRKIKHRKTQRRKIPRRSTRGNTLEFGEYGLQALAGAWLTANQIESVRVSVTRHIKRKGKVWIRVFPHKPVTKKPPETRQGKGKGNPEFWVAVVRPGHMLFEMSGVTESLAREAMRLGAFKLPFPCRFVIRTSQK